MLVADRLYSLVAALSSYQSDCAILPSCVYVSHCAPVVDCCDGGLIAAYVDGGRYEDLSECLSERVVTYAVEIWDCAPVVDDAGAAPAVKDIQEAAYSLAVKAEILIEAIRDFFTPPHGGFTAEDFSFDCLEPQGGCGGYKISITIKDMI